MSSDDYSTDEDLHHKHYTTERKTPQLTTATTSTDRLSPLPHSHSHSHSHPAAKRTPSRTPVAAPASPPYLSSSSDTETTDTETDTDHDTDDSTTSSHSPHTASSAHHTPRHQPPSPSLLYNQHTQSDRPAAHIAHAHSEATPLLPTAQAASALRSLFGGADGLEVEGEGVDGVGGELVSFMVGVDMELAVFVLRVVCVVLASVAIVSVSAEFTTWHVLLTAPVVIFALAAFFNANSSSRLLRHLLIACTVLCVLELANIGVSVLFFSLALLQLWYDTAVTVTLLVVLVLLFDNTRTRDRLTRRYIKQYTADRQRRDDDARDQADSSGPGWPDTAGGERDKRYGAGREGRRRSSGGMRERSLSLDEEERTLAGAGGREMEGVDSGLYDKQKPVSILDILQPSKDSGSEASFSPV